jgi:hypothetical protein
MSAFGPKEICLTRQSMSAYRGKADVAQTSGKADASNVAVVAAAPFGGSSRRVIDATDAHVLLHHLLGVARTDLAHQRRVHVVQLRRRMESNFWRTSLAAWRDPGVTRDLRDARHRDVKGFGNLPVAFDPVAVGVLGDNALEHRLAFLLGKVRAELTHQ